MEENTTLDILKQAILLERRGKAFYENIAEKAENKAVQDVFDMLAKEEQKHERRGARLSRHRARRGSVRDTCWPRKNKNTSKRCPSSSKHIAKTKNSSPAIFIIKIPEALHPRS